MGKDVVRMELQWSEMGWIITALGNGLWKITSFWGPNNLSTKFFFFF